MDQTLIDKDLSALQVVWTREQEELKAQLVVKDVEEWQIIRSLKLIGGMDLSFCKENPSMACCTLVVCNLDLEVVYEDSLLVSLTIPYIPGFLAFREVEPCLTLYKRLVTNYPEWIPQVVLLDGNGILHPRGLGLASHFGILADVCTIGVAKNLHQMGSLLRDETHLSKIHSLKEPGEMIELKDDKNQCIGVALKTCRGAKRPVYVSVGHRISLETAVWTVMQSVRRFRIPEPTRQADIRSRVVIKKNENKEIK